jgi:hypothetical protein
MKGRKRRVAFLAMIVLLSACGGEPGNRKETFPVTGQVFVDGEPAENLEVRCHEKNGLDKSNPTSSGTYTEKDGKFKISTYKSGDGVPEGDYALTFFWGQMNLISMSYGGPDKLNDRYNDPATSTHKVVVKKGKPADLGRIELTTK